MSAQHSSPILSTKGLTAYYGDFQALFGIDFEIYAGEAVAIIGANGAGKSTFLKSLVGLIDNAPDQIQLNGQPISHAPQRGCGARSGPGARGAAPVFIPDG